MKIRRRSFSRNAMAGIMETMIHRPPWELIIIVGLSAVALANVMLFFKRRAQEVRT